MPPLLTIAIPTYNRSRCLALLLARLVQELGTLENVHLLISNNASTDDTSQVIDQYANRFPSITVLTNVTNLGADFNIAQCYNNVKGKYAWIFGDDDLPIPGAISAVLAILQSESPDILYLRPQGIDGPLDNLNPRPIDHKLKVHSYSRDIFARQIHVFFSYISSVIVKRTEPPVSEESIARNMGTSLIQLGWTFPTLLEGGKFQLVEEPTFYCRTNNSGGFRIFDVWATNYLSIVRKLCSSDKKIRNILTHYLLIGFLPSLIYRERFGTSMGNFGKEPFFSTLYAATKTYPSFWLILAPTALLPKPLAFLFFNFSRVVFKLERVLTGSTAKRN
jgi:abequosyltransferase